MRKRGFQGRATADEQAETLKEAVYVAFTVLAVLLTTSAHTSAHATSDDLSGVAATVAITGVALTVTMFVADLLSHMAVHDAPMTRAELRHAVRSITSPLLMALLPIALLCIGDLAGWSFRGVLMGATISVGVTLGGVGWFAVRRATSNPWRRVAVLAAFVLLSFAAVAVQVIAHT